MRHAGRMAYMDENPCQSPKSPPEVERRPKKPPIPYWSVAKKLFKVLVFLPIVLALTYVINVLLKERYPTGTLKPLEIAGIIVVLAGLFFLIVRRPL